MLQYLLQEADAADGLPLEPPGFTVSRIVAPVSLGTGLRQVIPHLGIDLFNEMLQFGR